MYPRDQLLERERLGQMVSRAQVQTLHPADDAAWIGSSTQTALHLDDGSQAVHR
jgi:hypothetical protein